MKFMKALFVVVAVTVSSLALAEGGAERTFARMELAQKISMQANQVAQQRKAAAPVAESTTKAAGHANC